MIFRLLFFKDCRGHTSGDQCEQCLPGFEGDALRGDCHPRSDSDCYCDERGSVSANCNPDGSCVCKVVFFVVFFFFM